MPGKQEFSILNEQQPKVIHYANFGGSWVPVLGANSQEEALAATQEALANLLEGLGGDNEKFQNRLTSLDLEKGFNNEILTYGADEVRSNMVIARIKQSVDGDKKKWILSFF